MTGAISPEDRALIECIRKVNKTLSLFVFALQERSNVPTGSQIGIAEMLVALADTIKTRAAERAAGSNNAGLLLNSAVQQLQIEAPRGSTDPNG